MTRQAHEAQLHNMLNDAHMRLLRLARRAESRGLKDLAARIRDEAYTLAGDNAYGRYFQTYRFITL